MDTKFMNLESIYTFDPHRLVINLIDKMNLTRGDTQPAQDILGTSPEGPLKVITSRSYRGPSGDSLGPIQKLIIE